MKRVVGLMALLILVLTVTPAAADFYVIAGGGRLGTAITTVPFVITSPGLYYLNANLTSSGTTGYAITVNADDVTIDLMGFCLTGPGKTSGTGNSGISVAAARSNVEIRNGTIKAFGLDGISSEEGSPAVRVVGLRVRDIGGWGIFLWGPYSMVMDCTVVNAVNGIGVGLSSLVKGCQVQVSGYGINLIEGEAMAVGNTVRAGWLGVGASNAGSSVADNMVVGSGEYCVWVFDKCTVTRNTVIFTGSGPGIRAGKLCTITNNTTDRLLSGTGCTLADNTVSP